MAKLVKATKVLTTVPKPILLSRDHHSRNTKPNLYMNNRNQEMTHTDHHTRDRKQHVIKLPSDPLPKSLAQTALYQPEQSQPNMDHKIPDGRVISS